MSGETMMATPGRQRAWAPEGSGFARPGGEQHDGVPALRDVANNGFLLAAEFRMAEYPRSTSRGSFRAEGSALKGKVSNQIVIAGQR